MSTEIISRDKDVITIQVKINLAGSMLDAEETVQNAVNSLGKSATAEKLQSFDTDGSPIVLGAEKYTARSKDNKKYQTPYGEVNIERYVYQSSKLDFEQITFLVGKYAELRKPGNGSF